MESIKMDRKVVSKASLKEVRDDVSFYSEKTPVERLNYACDIIKAIVDSIPKKKADRIVFSSRKHTVFIQH